MLARGDLNRLWLVLGAIDALEDATLVNITKVVNMPKATVNDSLKKLISGQIIGVKIEKENSKYTIIEWLDLKESVRSNYKKMISQVGSSNL